VTDENGLAVPDPQVVVSEPGILFQRLTTDFQSTFHACINTVDVASRAVAAETTLREEYSMSYRLRFTVRKLRSDYGKRMRVACLPMEASNYLSFICERMCPTLPDGVSTPLDVRQRGCLVAARRIWFCSSTITLSPVQKLVIGSGELRIEIFCPKIRTSFPEISSFSIATPVMSNTGQLTVNSEHILPCLLREELMPKDIWRQQNGAEIAPLS
jgi:hypothetical protein